MIVESLFNRECGIVRKYNGKAQQAVLDLVVESFECHHLDEHLIEGQEFEDVVPPLACNFAKDCPWVFATADEDGCIRIYDGTIRSPLAVKQEWVAHSNAIFDIDYMPGGNKLLTASGDQTIAFWDVQEEEKISVFKGHSSSVRCVRWRGQDQFVFATGSRDGHIMVWDTRVKQKENGFIPNVNAIRNAHTCCLTRGSTPKSRARSKPDDSQQTVTAVIFQDNNTLISAGAGDGILKVWDLRKNYSTLKQEPLPKFKFEYAGKGACKHGFSSIILDGSSTQLYASCKDNVIYQYNCASYTPMPVACYRGHLTGTFYVKIALSGDGQYLLSGSSDNSAYIWKVGSPMRSPVALKGHSGEVSSVAWSPIDLCTLVTLSDDSTVRVWRAERRPSPSKPGTIVGTAERTHKEVGVTASSTLTSTSAVQMTCVSPHPSSKVTTLKASANTPPQLPIMQSSLLMSRSGSIGTKSKKNKESPKPNGGMASIMTWLSPAQSPGSTEKPSTAFTRHSSPRKTPRKLNLILSPRKSCGKKGEDDGSNTCCDLHKSSPVAPSGCQGAEVPLVGCQGTTTLSGSKHIVVPQELQVAASVNGSQNRGCKRKLDSDFLHAAPSKKLCTAERENVESPPQMPQSPVKTGADSRVLLALSCSNSDPTDLKCATTLSFLPKPDIRPRQQTPDKGDKLRSSVIGRHTVVSSPTSNLPNYVYDPQPRAPIAPSASEKEDKSKNPNWLTKLRMVKQASDVSDEPPSPKMRTPRKARLVCNGSQGSPSLDKMSQNSFESSPSQRSSRGSSPLTVQSPHAGRSILDYFSPRNKKKS